MPEHRLLAAVDIGSNSFRLLIGRVETTDMGDQIRPLDSLKESVRLAAGLSVDGYLNAASQRRGLEALNRFGERLRSFSPDAIRSVATNTLRVAKNARHFLTTSEAALGFPVEVISGHEEARLIYLGAAHALARDGVDRLVIDIGGGSTECIIGRDYEPALLESAAIGCVTISQRFFPGGAVSREAFEHACYASRAAIAPITMAYRRHGWGYAVGTSGTAKALALAVEQNFGATELTRSGLDSLIEALLKAGHVDRVKLEGLKPERRPVLAGGLAVMTAVFDELGIESMAYCSGALRQGVLYDLLGRAQGVDMREITVSRMVQRYTIDAAQGERVARTAIALFSQAARAPDEELKRQRQLLGWAARLAEVGMTLSHEDFHKHSAYILMHADMPGFSQAEQTLLANLALGQTGGLRKLKTLISEDRDWLMVLCLRIASILHRRRDEEEITVPALFSKRGRLRIEVPKTWAHERPLSDESLIAEAAIWTEVGVFEEFLYQYI
jgi:exopolyphosphatase / guanosine-5'-triphosphate,3'-diphosphate pyrophosphatase